jgi:hypothetical protein
MMSHFIFLGLTEIVQDIEDIRPPIAQHPLWGIVGILTALLVVALLAYAFWPNRGKVVLPPILPKEWAHSELTRLDGEIATLDPPEAAFRISWILRGFLERQYGLRACRQSTEEFLMHTAQQRLFAAGQRERLQEFLEGCDRLKFARATIATAPINLLRQATAWIDETV